MVGGFRRRQAGGTGRRADRGGGVPPALTPEHRDGQGLRAGPGARGGRPWRAAAVLLLLAACGGPGATPGQEARILALHNAERAALGVPPLRWDPALASAAEEWARVLIRSGRLDHSGGPAGENLWMGTAGAFGVERMVEAWLAEKGDLRRAARWEDAFPRVGHYTQMVWRESRALGCGLAEGGGREALVCRYSPAGNVAGRRPF